MRDALFADFPRYSFRRALLLARRCCGLLLFRFCRRRGRFRRNAVFSPKLTAPYGPDKRASGWLFGLGLSDGFMSCGRRILRKARTDQCNDETCCRGYLFHLRFASGPISMLGPRKSEHERIRLIREARAIYDSIFPPAGPVTEQSARAPTGHRTSEVKAYRSEGGLS